MRIQKNVPLKNKTTMKIGGRAEWYLSPNNLSSLIEGLNFAKNNSLTVKILGGGSNLLINETLITGLIIDMKKFNKITTTDQSIVADGGVTIEKLCDISINRSLSGLEFAGGLPGSIGGAAFMNARCYNSEFADIITMVEAVNLNGEIKQFTKEMINYSYKHSVFMDNEDLIIYRVHLQLKKADKRSIKNEADKNRMDRVTKGQFKYPSAGCVFKNDYVVGISSGKLIDESGLKGKSIGGAEVYPAHANFIINKNKATYKDIISLIDQVETTVKDKKNITLEREITIWDK